jgi:hypothetical protein
MYSGRRDRDRLKGLSGSGPEAAPCVKGRFFDRLDAKLNQLAKFDSNELVSIDLQAMATALSPGQEETVRCQTCAPRPKA